MYNSSNFHFIAANVTSVHLSRGPKDFSLLKQYFAVQLVGAGILSASFSLNPLTTNDTFWCRLTLAACYQLAQSVLKIGSVLAERVGRGEAGRLHPSG